MPIEEAPRTYNSRIIRDKIQNFWEEQQIYEKTRKKMEDKPKFSFLDGPPYCSGRIHLGTAWALSSTT